MPESTMKCAVQYPPDTEFPIENLPYGVFSTAKNPTRRIGVAIGDQILDLHSTKNVFKGPILSSKQDVFSQSTLNKFMELGKAAWVEARSSLQEYLCSAEKVKQGVFVAQREAQMHLPAQTGDFTDFYSSYYHVRNIYDMVLGKESKIQQNWSYIPVGYHGRASSIVVSGTPIQRPYGVTLPPPAEKGAPPNPPGFGPSKQFDFELETAFYVGGRPNQLGEPIPIEKADDYIFGMVLMNDWTARDIALYEYVPLGPLVGKDMGTTISPWVVTMEALRPFIVPNVKQDPQPHPYLRHNDNYNFDINIQLDIKTKDSTTTISRTNYKYMYWNQKQQLAHHAVTGCNMVAGDLLAAGTISGPTPDSLGSLLEITHKGTKTLTLKNGETRRWLEDGDDVVMTAFCQGSNYRIGFGVCSGEVLPIKS